MGCMGYRACPCECEDGGLIFNEDREILTAGDGAYPKMKKMQYANVFTVFHCASIVLMLILLYGCAGTTHTPMTESVPTVTTETHTVVEQLVKNPETGAYEVNYPSLKTWACANRLPSGQSIR